MLKLIHHCIQDGIYSNQIGGGDLKLHTWENTPAEAMVLCAA